MQVSVVMPAYNASHFIGKAVDSVLAQTWRDFELIVIDDGSTDNTLELLRECAARDSRVKVYAHANMGLSETLNKGISLAANEWIFRMDNDDLMRPNRMERQLAFVQEHPDLAVASSLVHHIDDKDRVIGKDNSRLFTYEAIQARVDKNIMIGFCHPAVLMRKSVVQEVGGYRKQFWPAEDLDLWNRIVEKGYKVLVQPEYLLDYRIHGNSSSIARARLASMKVRWIKDSMVRRRAGLLELDLDSFLSNMRSASLVVRLNRARKDLAKIFYKEAVSKYAHRRYVSTMIRLLTATLLQPTYALRQVYTKAAIGRQHEVL